jgi:hypothetical protein
LPDQSGISARHSIAEQATKTAAKWVHLMGNSSYIASGHSRLSRGFLLPVVSHRLIAAQAQTDPRKHARELAVGKSGC